MAEVLPGIVWEGCLRLLPTEVQATRVFDQFFPTQLSSTLTDLDQTWQESSLGRTQQIKHLKVYCNIWKIEYSCERLHSDFLSQIFTVVKDGMG